MPPNPSELIESAAMDGVLAQLAERYELVVVDTAPMGVVSDAFPLLRKVDGVIAVTRIGMCTRDRARAARASGRSGSARGASITTAVFRPAPAQHWLNANTSSIQRIRHTSAASGADPLPASGGARRSRRAWLPTALFSPSPKVVKSSSRKT